VTASAFDIVAYADGSSHGLRRDTLGDVSAEDGYDWSVPLRRAALPLAIGWLAVSVLSCGARTELHSLSCRVDADCGAGRCSDAGVCAPAPAPTLTPQPSFETVFAQTQIDKADLLFVIDNSASMSDKQQLLADGLRALVKRLLDSQSSIRDMHIGVISSSLGGHGADSCSASSSTWNPTQNDQSRLMATVRPNLPSYQDRGFLAWDPDGKNGGHTSAAALLDDFQQHVMQTGQQGCGFEATLEAWYRFLVDPSPPLRVVRGANDEAVAEGTDDTLLEQRRAFLRPDSLVAIVMVSDENDCSIVDGGMGWLAAQDAYPFTAVPPRTFHLPQATSACSSDPNDACCRSCGSTAPTPPGCVPLGADPACQSQHDDDSDRLNLRCWEQKRRFGVDFLHPTSRYVDALRSQIIRDRAGNETPNPLLTDTNGGTAPPRDPGVVFLIGIVGVPWQDIATRESLNDPTRLDYQRADHIPWDWIVGDVNQRVLPVDPLMIEQPEPRSGINPALQAPLAPATSLNPEENPINGHEYVALSRSAIPGQVEPPDLQYACIFDLEPDRDCSADNSDCDCRPSELSANKPLCQPPGGGPAGTIQYWGKAYPSLRQLQVLKDVGENGVVVSICPKIIDATHDDYLFSPAFEPIIVRTKPVGHAVCLPGPLPTDTSAPDFGAVTCDLVEVEVAPACDGCDASRGRSDLAPTDPLVTAARAKLAELGRCRAPCADACVCRIEQLTGEALRSCQAGTGTAPGFCYVDPALGIGSPAATVGCPDEPRALLVFGARPPSAVTMLSCTGGSR
jgi:hypothetical protein